MSARPARGSRTLAYAASCYAIASVSFAPAIHANFLSALSRDFRLDMAGSSLYLSLNFWGALASIVVAGPLAGRLGSRAVLTAAWLLELIAVTAIGVAPFPLVAYAGVLLASLGFGAISVLVPHMVSGLYPERRNRAMSLLVSFYTLGAVASNLLVLLLFSVGASWRVGYLAASAMALPWGIMMLASRGSADGAQSAVKLPAEGPTSVEPPPTHPPETRWAIGFFAVLCVAQLAASAAEVSTSMWIPTFLTREAGAPSAYGPVSLLLFCVMGAVGKLVNAAAIARVKPGLLVGAGLALFAGGLVLAVLSTSPAAALVGFCIVGLGTGGFVPTVTVRLAERFPRASASRYSIFMAVANLGPIGGPVLIGMAAGGDLRRGMLTMLPAAALACLLLLLLPRRVRAPTVPSPAPR
jgi:MFS family permease